MNGREGVEEGIGGKEGGSGRDGEEGRGWHGDGGTKLVVIHHVVNYNESGSPSGVLRAQF